MKRSILNVMCGLGLISATSAVFAGPRPAPVDNRPVSAIPLWKSYDTFSFTLDAPFKTLFGASPDALVPGKIHYKDGDGTDVAIPVSVRIRGDSSKTDCPFPKLDVGFDADTDLSETVFANAKGFKVGTHCADVPGISGKYGRLRNQLEPHREALLYRILDILQVQSYIARPARVTYVFTDDANNSILRNAFLIESTGDFEKRNKATEIFPVGSDEEIAAEAAAAKRGETVPGTFSDAVDPEVDIDQAAMAYVANAMMGNPDFDVTVDGQSKAHNILWNTKAFIRKDGTKFLVPYDFDLVYMIVDPTRIDQMTSQMQDFVAKFSPFKEAIANAESRIQNKRSEMLQAVQDFDWIYYDIQTGAAATDETAIALIPAWLDELQSYIDARL